MKYIFLDRDGVINEDVDCLHKAEDLRLIPRSAEAIRLLNEADYTVIVITNQAVIARGLCTEEELGSIHATLDQLLEAHGAHIDKYYYCPHHPRSAVNPKYLADCTCRKPKPGMILRAQQDCGMASLSSCFLVGDKMSDIGAGAAAGCRTILVETGYGGSDGEAAVTPEYRAKDLYDAVANIILR